VYAVTDVPFTLFEAVNRAGGLLPTADDSQLVLVRGSKAWRLNFQSVLSSGGRLGQIILQDGDTLQIPSASDSLAYMMGELVRPGNIQLGHGNRSLAKAISEAGGLQVTSSDATSIYVIRSANTSNAVDVFHMDARNPAAMVLADRFALNPGDIVYVDSGSLVRFNRVMNLLLPSISAATNSALAAAESHYFIKYR
jgi:polysaccharide export outer membrane protein